MGTLDISLNTYGKKEAFKIRRQLDDLSFNCIYSSPLKRCIETARIISPDVQILKEKDLQERNIGVFEGLTKVEAKKHFPHLYARIITRVWKESPYGGETIAAVQTRVFSFLDNLKQRQTDGNVLIVTHGFISKMINYYFYQDLSEEEFHMFSLKNCEFKCYKL